MKLRDQMGPMLQHREEAPALQSKAEQIEAISEKARSRAPIGSRRALAVSAAILTTSFAGLGWYGHDQLYGSSAQRGLAKELASARAEGILTNAQEISATIRPVPENQNAGPLAIKMLEAKPKSAHFRDLVWDASLGKDEKRLQEVKSVVEESTELIDLAQQAASRPSFVVGRDYSRGSLLLTPEFAGFTYGIDALRVLAAMKMREGRSGEALKVFDQSMQLTALLESDQMWLQFGARGLQRERAASLAASWAWLNPGSNEWRKALRKTLDSWSIPTERQAHRYTLALALETFDRVKQHSRAELGFSKPPDWMMTVISKFSPELASRTKAVKGFRRAWSVMDTPGTANDQARREASDLYSRGLLHDPTLYQTTAILGPGDGLDQRQAILDARQRKALFEAVYEVLSMPRVEAKKTTVSKTLSPYSGLPFRIRWSANGFSVSEASAGSPLQNRSIVIPPTRQQWKENNY